MDLISAFASGPHPFPTPASWLAQTRAVVLAPLDLHMDVSSVDESLERQRKLGFAILQHLSQYTGSCGDDEAEGLDVALELIGAAFGISVYSDADREKYAVALPLLEAFELGVGGKAEIERAVQTYLASAGIEKAVSKEPEAVVDPRLGKFIEALAGKGYFADVTEGSPEYAERYQRAKDMFSLKFGPSSSDSSPAAAAAAAAEAPPGGAALSAETLAMAENLKKEGNDAFRAGRHEEAKRLYTQAIKLAPNAIFYANRAGVFSVQGDHKSAIADCKSAIELDPTYAKAYSRLGTALFSLGRYKEALEFGYEKAIKYDPENATTKEGMRIVMEKLKEQRDRESGVTLTAPSSAAPAAEAGGFGGGGAGGTGALPDLAGLASAMGGAGGMGSMADAMSNMNFGEMMNNPEMMNMAQNIASSPMFSNLMSNPAFMSMAQNLMSNPDVMGGLMRDMPGGLGGMPGSPSTPHDDGSGGHHETRTKLGKWQLEDIGSALQTSNIEKLPIPRAIPITSRKAALIFGQMSLADSATNGWKSQYIDGVLIKSGHVKDAAIWGLDELGQWACTPGFELEKNEVEKVKVAFNDCTPFQRMGVTLHHEWYVVIRNSPDSIYCKRKGGGLVLVKTKQAIMLVTYIGDTAPGQCTFEVEKLADYLRGVGY